MTNDCLYSEPYEEIKQKILAGERLGCPDQLRLVTGGETLYSEVMLPCWSSHPHTRPTFSSLVSRLEVLVGEERVSQYQDMVRSYMQRLPLIQRTGRETPLPPYIQSEKTDNYYMKMEAAEADRVRPSGYIALGHVNNK